MDEELYRLILRMKALERWENEGGRIIDDQKERIMVGSTDAMAGTYIGTGQPDVERTSNKRDNA